MRGKGPQIDRFIPLDQVQAAMDEPPYEDADIVLHCPAGNISTTVAGELVALGYATNRASWRL